MRRILIHNARVFPPSAEAFNGAVLIEDEDIRGVFHAQEMPALTSEDILRVDAHGALLLPGVIDTHVHFRTPGMTHKADIRSESAAALAGGVTSVVDMPNTQPLTTTQGALEGKLALFQRDCRVNYALMLGATNTNLEEVEKADPSLYAALKVFMGSSTGNMLVDSTQSLEMLFLKSRKLIVTHCEEQAIIRENTLRLKQEHGTEDDLPISCHPLVRSREACLESSRKAVSLALRTGARLHLAHISTRDELALLKTGDLDQKQVTSEAVAGHLRFSEEDYPRLGGLIKCNPAIKTAEDREALWEALEKDLIDTVATDHAPHLLSEKQGGALRALSGMPMLQFSLPLMLTEAERRGCALEHIVRKMTMDSARLFRIERRGAILEGHRADLVLVRRNPWKIEREMILSKCGWSPLEGDTLAYQVEATWLNGHLAYTISDGLTKSDLRGERLTFRC